MTLSLDGNANGNSTFSTTVAASLTTSNTDDIIVALVATKHDGSSAPAISVADGSSLTWTQRYQLNSSDESYGIFWAHAASALSGDTITATLSVSSSENTIIVFGVSGADTSYPFDNNASLTKHASGTSTAPAATGVSTDATDTFLIGFGAAESIGGFSWSGPGSSLTTIDTAAASAFVNFKSYADYKIVASPQSGATIDAVLSTSAAWNFFADAIVAAGEGTAPPAASTKAAALLLGL